MFCCEESLEILPDVGEIYIIGAGRQNIFVHGRNIRGTISAVGPLSSALQKSIWIIRQLCIVPAPNSLW